MTEQDDDIVSVCNNIKSNICSKVSIDNFSKVTPQIIADCGPLKKKELAKHLLNLIASCDQYDHIMPDGDNIAVRVNFNQTEFENDIKELIENGIKGHISPSNSVNLNSISSNILSITSQLNELKSCVDDIKTSTIYIPHETESKFTEQPSLHAQADENITPSDILCYDEYKNDFVSDSATLSELKQYLDSDQCIFSHENGHSVSAFGERYRYTGSKSNDKSDTPIPEKINKIVCKINSDFNCNVNSVLVNKYTGRDSFLPEHSDDEASIDPESCIYTLSLGHTRTVIFSNKYSKVESKVSVEDNSLYVMSRDSQNFFRHRIDKEVVPEDSTRYSLTFRCLSNKYRRSTIIIGDSLSSQFKFGEGEGTFGRGLPGKVVKSSKLSDIRPTDCLSYSNVVIQCGINDLRQGINQTASAVNNKFNILKDKITTMLQLKDKINIFICPILPTRSVYYNQRVVTFNRLIRSQIVNQNYRCSLLDVSSFCDATYKTDLLDPSFCRSQGDPVHLNSLGTRKLAGIIKTAIFLKYNSGKGSRISSTRPYASAVRDGRQWPRLAGTPSP